MLVAAWYNLSCIPFCSETTGLEISGIDSEVESKLKGTNLSRICSEG